MDGLRGRCLETVAGLAAALALWTVGLVAVVPPSAMGLLLGLSVLCGLRLLASPRRRILSAAGVVTLATVAVYLLVLFHVDDRTVPIERRVVASEGKVDRLRILDLNVLHGYPRFENHERRYRSLVAALRELEPTVVVLQEAWSVVGHGRLTERLGAELGLDVAYARSNGSRRLLGFEEGGAVLSRLPIVSARRLVLSPRRPTWEARIALVAVLDVGGGETLAVVGTHLAHRDPGVAVAQARDLVGKLEPHELAVVAGDLNSPSGGPAVAAFEEHGLVDVVRGGIDHVLVRQDGGWQVEHADWTLRPLTELTSEVAVSDHPGILVDLARRLEDRTGMRYNHEER